MLAQMMGNLLSIPGETHPEETHPEETSDELLVIQAWTGSLSFVKITEGLQEYW
jgi:hypothetical protein